MVKPNRFFLFFLALTLGALGACASLSQVQNQTENETMTDIRFEDYKTEAEARQRLSQIFPDGTDLETFKTTMMELGVSCEEYIDPELKTQKIGCHYDPKGGGIVKTRWLISADIDREQKVSELVVERGFIGP